MGKCLWGKQWHQSCKHLQDTWTLSFFGPDDKMFSTGLNLSQTKKKDGLSKGQNHLEIIL